MYLWRWSRWTPSNPLFLDPSFVTESRFGFVFLFNDHFVSSMSPSLCWKTDADASVWAKPSRQTAHQSWSSEQTGWVLPDGDLEGASCKTFVKQTKQGYTDLYKYEQGNCWPTYDQIAQTGLPVIHLWYDSCVSGLAGENRADGGSRLHRFGLGNRWIKSRMDNLNNATKNRRMMGFSSGNKVKMCNL